MRSAAECPSMVSLYGVASNQAIRGKTALRPHYGSPYGEPLQGRCISTVTAREVSFYGVGSAQSYCVTPPRPCQRMKKRT